MNIVEPILFQSRCQPLALALCAAGAPLGHVTYAQLAGFIHNIGRRALGQGLVRGNVVALSITDPILHALFILALARLGIVSISAPQRAVPKELGIDLVFTDNAGPAVAGRRVLAIDPSWTTGEGSPQGGAVDDDGPEKICRIVLTSGTTGQPKAVALTNRHIFTRVARVQTACGQRFSECSRIFIDMALSTSIGLVFLIYTLSRGGAVFLRGGGVAETLEALSAHRVQAMIVATGSLAEIADICDQTAAFPGGFDAVIAAGSLLTRELSERVRARLSSNLVSTYGSTEAGLVATAPAQGVAATDGAVGYVLAGVAVDIVDRAGARLSPATEGLVSIRSDGLVAAYMDDREETEQRFRNGGFLPGDLGVLRPDGMLVITGRADALINVGGNKMNPERIEAALISFPGVRDAAAFAIRTRLGVSLVGSAVVWRGEADEAALRAHAERCVRLQFVPQLFLAVDSIPRTDTGKVDQVRLKQLIAQRVREIETQNASAP